MKSQDKFIALLHDIAKKSNTSTLLLEAIENGYKAFCEAEETDSNVDQSASTTDIAQTESAKNTDTTDHSNTTATVPNDANHNTDEYWPSRKDELEGKHVPSQEEFNKFFEENIFSKIDYSKTKFLDSHGNVSSIPTCRIELRDSNNKWLFDYDYKHFWYSYNSIYPILQEKFHLQTVDTIRLMTNLVETYFMLMNITPESMCAN